MCVPVSLNGTPGFPRASSPVRFVDDVFGRRSSDAGFRVAGLAPLLLAVAVSPFSVGGSSTSASVGGTGSASGASGAGAVGGSGHLNPRARKVGECHVCTVALVLRCVVLSVGSLPLVPVDIHPLLWCVAGMVIRSVASEASWTCQAHRHHRRKAAFSFTARVRRVFLE